MRYLKYLLLLLLVNCTKKVPENKVALLPENSCGCRLTDQEMIEKLPITAIGDSIVVCKVGTNYVAGSGRDAMTWLEYLQSEYHGFEGSIYDCVREASFKQLYDSRILSYRDKKIIIDYRFPIDVYDATSGKWIDLELQTYSQTIYANNGTISYSAPALIFKPPLQPSKAFALTNTEYEKEAARTDHYMISTTMKRLFTCAVNGDEKSRKRFLNLTTDFKAYYDKDDYSLKYYHKYLKLYQDYMNYLQKGGKKTYYDLTVFNLKNSK
ncbi:hypothetical protein ACI6PS_06050 [Flavobacterium sp. PLA-1-15]|uniref:hypothetical protein n=1 Tax=Flavobacterium sp. PLA-1-15 TaxID=3380533 RepID=UPI003B797E00